MSSFDAWFELYWHALPGKGNVPSVKEQLRQLALAAWTAAKEEEFSVEYHQKVA